MTVPIERVIAIAERGVCWSSCTHRDCDAARLAGEVLAHRAHRREHLAWLIWCINEGYVKAEDRANLDNWLLEDPAKLHPHDAELRPHLLAMADEVLGSEGG